MNFSTHARCGNWLVASGFALLASACFGGDTTAPQNSGHGGGSATAAANASAASGGPSGSGTSGQSTSGAGGGSTSCGAIAPDAMISDFESGAAQMAKAGTPMRSGSWFLLGDKASP